MVDESVMHAIVREKRATTGGEQYDLCNDWCIRVRYVEYQERRI